MDFKRLITYFVIIVSFLALVCFGLFFVYGLVNKKDSAVYYEQGLEYYQKKDYQNAYYNFSKILPTSDLYLNSLYRQAKSADMIDDKKTALKKYLLFDKMYKNEFVSPYILWRIGNLYQDKNEIKNAKKVFLRLKNDYPDSEYGIASNYHLSKYEKNSKKYLIEYLKKSPKGRFSENVISTLIESDLGNLTDEEKIILSNSLFENEAYNQAIYVLKQAPIEKSWVLLVKVLDKLNSSNNVIKVATKGFSLDCSSFDEEELLNIVEIFIKHSKKSPYDSTKEVFETTLDNTIKGLALYKNSNYSTLPEKIRKKTSFYESYPESKYASSVLFDLFIDAISQNKTVLALKYGKLHIAKYEDKTYTPCVLYFVATLKKRIMDSTYKVQLDRLIKKYPQSYYSYRAYSTLIKPDFSNKRDLKITNKTFIDFPHNADKKTYDFFNNFALMKDDFVYDDFRINDEILKSWIEYQKGNKALSSVIARNYIQNSSEAIERNNVAWKLAYPIYYQNEINNYSKLNDLNPYLILSLIKEESHFNSNIISPVGAVGLMQIMPSTAQMVSGVNYSQGELKMPKLNIELGTKYFAYLMDEFSNNEPLCVLSYNAGPNAVKKWLKNNSNLAFDILVENIPYAETKSYIKKVYVAYWNYLLTYGGVKI